MSQLFPTGDKSAADCYQAYPPVCVDKLPFTGQILDYFRQENNGKIASSIDPATTHVLPGTTWNTTNGTMDDLYELEIELQVGRTDDGIAPFYIRFITGEFVLNGEVISSQVTTLGEVFAGAGVGSQWTLYCRSTFRVLPNALPVQIQFQMRHAGALPLPTQPFAGETVYVTIFYRRIHLPLREGVNDGKVFITI